ncbi:hypothetical protein DINM_006501 [Dirofilaria immitis]|nr:hypothetical protein [Dirofilaria immitis]
MNGYYRNGPRFDRIDQDEVPESKHTVFIRGLPGHIKTDEVNLHLFPNSLLALCAVIFEVKFYDKKGICKNTSLFSWLLLLLHCRFGLRDFFEDHVGPCSFDFIKLSQDQLKLFVAVRFETRDAAKECMHKYKDGDVLGYPVEMTWFRDIRRYVSYQQSQGLRPAKIPRSRGYSGRNRTSYDRSSRNDYRDDDDYDKGNKRKCASSDGEDSKNLVHPTGVCFVFSCFQMRISMLHFIGFVHDSSRSPSQRRLSHERSTSRNSIKSQHSEKSHRSQSHTSSYLAPAHERSSSPAPPALFPQIKRETIERGETPPLPPLPPPPNVKSDDIEPKKLSPSGSQSPIERKSRKSKKSKKSVGVVVLHQVHPIQLMNTLQMNLVKPVVKPTLGKWEEQEAETTLLQNTTLKFGLESTYATMSQAAGIENSFSCKKGAKELEKQLDLSKGEAPSSGALFTSDIDAYLGKREQIGPINDLKNTQTNMFGTARGQQVVSFFDDASDTLQPPQGTLRLSSLTLQLNAETERERKLARLPPEVLTKYTTKKKQLETAFKADRETFGFVTKMLIEKDPSLEDRLWLALAEAIKDMEEAFTRKMDQYLDQLIITLHQFYLDERAHGDAKFLNFAVSNFIFFGQKLVKGDGSPRYAGKTLMHYGKFMRRHEQEKRSEQLFEKYCLLFMKRLEQQNIGVLTVGDLFAIAIKYGFKEVGFRYFKEIAARWMCRRLEVIMRNKGLYGLPRNLSLINIFIEIDDLECSLDYSKWLEEFMTPFFGWFNILLIVLFVSENWKHGSTCTTFFIVSLQRQKDSIYREVRQHDFKQRIILIREAVLNQDWSQVGAFIGHLPSFRQNLRNVPETFRKQLGGNLDKTCRMLFPYASTIFRTGVERFMQYDIPRDMITKSAAELMLVLIDADRKYSNFTYDVENNSLFYITELLIYAVANGQKQEMHDLITVILSLPSVAQKHKYITILRAYKVLSRYECWRLGREENVSQSSSFDLGDEIIAALLDVESGQASVFTYTAVHYLHCIGKINVLMDALVECCHKTPCMIIDCYRALLLNNMVDKASLLLDAVLPQCSFITHPILLDWLKPRLLNPHDYDLPREMLQHICKILFIFLDYGMNRRNDYAWMFLWAAVQHMHDDNLYLHWDSRKSWWPKFHRAELSEAGADCRHRVFTKLFSLNV